MAKYPLFLELGGKRVVVIGAGKVAARKVLSLHAAGANVTVVTKRVDESFTQICDGLDIEVIVAQYSEEYLAGAVLAIAATDDNDLNTQVYADCQARKVICNVVDVPHLCDFYVPARVNRGDLQIAIGTNGKSPAYAGYIRRKLEGMFTEEHGRFVDELNVIRGRVIEKIDSLKVRKEILKQLATDETFEIFSSEGVEALHRLGDKLIEEYSD